MVFSDQKHLNGFTAGVIAGNRDLIDATARQTMGLGRAMKPTKEGIVSVIATMEWLRTFDRDAYFADMDAKTDPVVDAMAEGAGRYGHFRTGHHRQPAGPREDHRRPRDYGHDG